MTAPFSILRSGNVMDDKLFSENENTLNLINAINNNNAMSMLAII